MLVSSGCLLRCVQASTARELSEVKDMVKELEDSMSHETNMKVSAAAWFFALPYLRVEHCAFRTNAAHENCSREKHGSQK